jgi:hypothetical protein
MTVQRKASIMVRGTMGTALLLAAALSVGGCSGSQGGGGNFGAGGAAGGNGQGGTGGMGSGGMGSGGMGSGGMGSGGSGGLGPGQCRTDADCTGNGGVFCLAPGESPGCGVCYIPPNPCTADAECTAMGAAFICEPAHCSCMGQSECKEGCTTNAQCAPSEVCELATHRCAGKPCAKDADCPQNFACGAADKRCARKPCASDAACQGTCVEGLCYDMPGTCSFPVP